VADGTTYEIDIPVDGSQAVAAASTLDSLAQALDRARAASTAAAGDSDNPDNEPSECGGLCRPDRCPAGYYYSGPPNCSCLPKK
jgi:hypothetical protein